MAPTNEQVSEMMSDVYNVFWKKWRNRSNLTNDEWDDLVREISAYGEKYKAFEITVDGKSYGPIVVRLINFFLTVIEERERSANYGSN